MQGRKPKANQRFHDRIASRYDEIYSEKNPYWRFYREITWRRLKPFLPREAGARILDLGCGTGEWGIRFLKSGFRVCFVDLSQEMLEAARRRAAEEAPRGAAEFVQADLVDLSALPSGEFAFATAQGDPLSLCSDPARAVRETARLLRPGGIFVASVDNRCAAYDFYLESADAEGLLAFHRSGETIWLARRREERFPVRTFDPDGLRNLFSRSGFEPLELVGKTILPVRRHPALLEDPESYRVLLRIEEELHRREAYLGRASHLQIAARLKSASSRKG